MSNPWDVLPIEPTGDTDQTRLYTAVGIALSRWEELNDCVARLFATLVRSKNGAAEAAYGMVMSSASRADMLLAAANHTIAGDSDLHQGATSLLNEVGQMAGRRNDIAHGTVTHFSGQHGGGPMTRYGSYLVPPGYNTRKKVPPSKWEIPKEGEFWRIILVSHRYAYTSAQIKIYIEHFIRYRRRVVEITEQVRVLLDRLDEANKE